MRRILLIAVPGLGDAFLATPLLHSLKRAYPDASIDMLVRDGKAAVEGNPDVSRVLVQPRRPSFFESVSFLARIFRRYDLALSTSTSDRTFINMFFAAPQRVGKIAAIGPKTWWKRKLVRNFVLVDPREHVLSENLRIADLLGIPRHYPARLPFSPNGSVVKASTLPLGISGQSYAVVHMRPGAVVRQWPDEHWQVLIGALRRRGLAVVATGSESASERAYIERILSRAAAAAENLPPVWNLVGRLPFHEVVGVIQGAVVFVGPDTSTTHVAAATGVPTVALFGSTDPVRWGPWPTGLEHDRSPWSNEVLSQTAVNVVLLRTSCHCDPRRQICARRPGEPGSCMSRLLPDAVLVAIDGLLERSGAVAGLEHAARIPAQQELHSGAFQATRGQSCEQIKDKTRGHHSPGELP
jgi:heptosyltransferase-3